MPPKVSIGMPVYNGEEYLQGAIDSLLVQTFEDFELIISDNCSTDSTSEISQLAVARDSRVRYVRQSTNLGAVGNFNVLIDLAHGEYFKWAAHDDVMEPTFVERCVEALDRNPTFAWCHSQSSMIDANGNSLLELLPETAEELQIDDSGQRAWKGHPRSGYGSPDPIQRFAGVILGTNWCVDAYGLFRLAMLKQSRRLLSFYGAEKILLGELSLLGAYYETPELLFCQRIHDKASSNLDSATAQAEFAGSNESRNPFVSSRLAILQAHAGSVLRAPLTLTQKLRGIFVVFCYVVQFKKWQRTISSWIHGSGIGGGGSRLLKSIAKDNESGSNDGPGNLQ